MGSNLGRGAVLLVRTLCSLVGGWVSKNFGENQKYFSTFGPNFGHFLPLSVYKTSNFRAARAKKWILILSIDLSKSKDTMKFESCHKNTWNYLMLDLIPNIKLNMTIFSYLSGKYTDFLDWVRGAYAEIRPISKSTGVLLDLSLGVGGSPPKILVIFQKYGWFDIVSEPKVLPPRMIL